MNRAFESAKINSGAGAVPGKNHDDECQEVLRQGSKLCADEARLLFPEFKDLPYAP
jgi:hypothetical protein